MPRAKSVPSTPERRQFESIWTAQFGSAPEFVLTDWDGDAQLFYQAVLSVLSTGASVFIRAGSGARAIGFAVWDGDNRLPATWCYEQAELDALCTAIISRVESLKK